MKKTALFFLLLFPLLTFSQDFFREAFDSGKNYILLANPTVDNIETVDFLVKSKLLKLNLKKTIFVGVYYEKQQYDFSKTAEFIQKNNLSQFRLHEFRGDLEEKNLFDTNLFRKEFESVFQNSTAVFFFGGPDIPPSVYGEDNTRSVVTDPQRHFFETTFLFHLLGSYRNDDFMPFLETNPKYFVTGFCLGMQTMNVATGGTLIQDIPSEIYDAPTDEDALKLDRENLHRNYWGKFSDDSQLMRVNFHTIQFAISKNPFFTQKVKAGRNLNPLVLSNHHQAAEKIGKGFEVTALSADGKIVEGIAHTKYPNVFAVQFHPEAPALYENRAKVKFHPEDEAVTYYEILGRENLKFHKKYWKFISKSLQKSAKRK